MTRPARDERRRGSDRVPARGARAGAAVCTGHRYPGETGGPHSCSLRSAAYRPALDGLPQAVGVMTSPAQVAREMT